MDATDFWIIAVIRGHYEGIIQNNDKLWTTHHMFCTSNFLFSVFLVSDYTISSFEIKICKQILGVIMKSGHEIIESVEMYKIMKPCVKMNAQLSTTFPQGDHRPLVFAEEKIIPDLLLLCPILFEPSMIYLTNWNVKLFNNSNLILEYWFSLT